MKFFLLEKILIFRVKDENKQIRHFSSDTHLQKLYTILGGEMTRLLWILAATTKELFTLDLLSILYKKQKPTTREIKDRTKGEGRKIGFYY